VSGDVRAQLQHTLSGSYTLERELGGGGMSRVFVADETRLGRKVVVKVLSPELAAGISAERFEREIKLAASLQQANIVPVLSAGDSGGLPYYTMPFVEGESLRERLRTRAALPIAEAVSVLRDVARALAYAHERGIVHRDIKPDNVLLSGGAAVVTDFGIAKAISASRTGSGGATLTQLGTSIGTPAYISPEQAAGDPDIDYRADIYSFGCMAYELLAGQPPFANRTPQRLMAAHMAEKPRHVSELRLDAPPALAAMVMRCLEKDANLRPQSALELLEGLEATTTSGATHGAMPAILLGGRGMLKKALAAYAAAFVVVAILAKAAIVGIGLPDWVFPGALVVMALGLPVILFTAYTQYVARRAVTASPTFTPGGSPSIVTHGTLANIAMKASPHVSWRRTTLGGAAAFGVFLVLVAGYMITRALGIGPAASLMGAGVLGAREKLLVADFKSPAGDTTLGPVVTEAFRSDLAQSRNVDIVQPTTVREALRRMRRSPDTQVDFPLAREIATREGVKAVIDGEVLGLGGSYVIAAKLYSAQNGDVLASFRVTAADGKEIIAAIDKLSRDVRTKIGESLRSVNAAPPLEQVTTPSLEALKKYVQAVRVFAQPDFDKGITLLQDAIALDSGFAMAYRKLAVELGNHGGFDAKVVAAVSKAYEHRDRLSETERHLTEAAYWRSGPRPDNAKSIAAYEALLEIQPDNTTALNNMAQLFADLRRFDKEKEYAARAVALNKTTATYWGHLATASINLGYLDSAQRVADEMAKHLPASTTLLRGQLILAWVRADFDSVERVLAAWRARSPDRGTRRWLAAAGSWSAQLHGRLRDAARLRAEWRDIDQRQGVAAAPLTAEATTALDEAWFTENKRSANLRLDSALRAFRLDKVDPLERPYLLLVRAYARAGRPDRAQAMLAGFDSSRVQAGRPYDDIERHVMRGDVAMAGVRYDEAIREYRAAADLGRCIGCVLSDLARAYDLAGNADSARAILTRYVEMRNDAWRWQDEAPYLAGSYKRLGELWEGKDDKKAASYYTKFVELWKNADPELQPKVAEVRKKLARLAASEKR
jgi:tetratricopeptide (TPR) repeat protein